MAPLSPRALQVAYHLFFPVMFLIGGVVLALSALPAALLFQFVLASTSGWNHVLRTFLLALTAAYGYFLFGGTLLFVIPAFVKLTRTRGHTGSVPVMSVEAGVFAAYNGMILMARFIILPWLRTSPLLVTFYRMMGAKIGKNALINSTVIHDLDLLTLGDHVVIGGDACIIAHAGEGNMLHRAPIKIGSHVSIGQYTTVLAGVEIGDNVIIGANSLVPKGAKIPPNGVWGGVPVKKIRDLPPRPPA